ncbi:MAG: RNA-binding transcriptional accessory protein [Planctomycetes bacterium]|nr:RNA-binding transcriptional accessory protein [Planctomycetota bacterium]
MSVDSSHFVSRISAKLKLKANNVQAAISLLDEDATIPFIARYRKEATGSLDEVALQAIADELGLAKDLDKRKSSILASLEKREILTDEMRKQIQSFEGMSALEDYYLPYKVKKQTRAQKARDKGLEPLAKQLYAQENAPIAASQYINSEKDVQSEDDAWQGAMDIVAEWIAENAKVRAQLREAYLNFAFLQAKVIKSKKSDAEKYLDYFDWQEAAHKCPSHRLLAILRGESEGYLRVSLKLADGQGESLLSSVVLKNKNCAERKRLDSAIKDSYERLLHPSIETETFKHYKLKSDIEAISVFSENLRQLLFSAPLGAKRVMAVDPGLRTGCKVVVLNEQGDFKKNFTIYPSQGEKQKSAAMEMLKESIAKDDIQAIAVGNGTGGRETESFIRDLAGSIPVVSINESGASIYSASECARKEFPDLDLTVRGAISIGRRMQDPMAELVKLDPKVIGVGQYQHDVDQSLLKKRLDESVQSCVNLVGVELNSASEELLTYVSGLGPQLAANIVKHRQENGPFKSRAQLKKVPRLGPKAFEQAAGFLRIRSAKNPLDASAVHPESYGVVDQMAKDQASSLQDLTTKAELRTKIDLKKYQSEKLGLPTLRDILEELGKPGRDPRPEFEMFSFSEEVHEMTDLEEGMILPGLVTNITRFGAFVDVGVHQDGLVHISQLSDSFVKDPADIVKLRQKVRVKVTEIDLKRKRIALSMKGLAQK